MSRDKRMDLLDDLQNLLEKQIVLAHQGNISDVEIVSKQAGRLVEEITQSGVVELDEFKKRRKQLRKLYEELCLAVTAQKADLTEKLSRVRKGKKTVKTYRKNV